MDNKKSKKSVAEEIPATEVVKEEMPIVAKKEEASIVVKRERIGVFMQDWKLVKSYGHASSNSHIESFKAGKIVFNEADIESFVNQGAPVRIYVHDVESTASRTD